jgi:hypothetical protein
MCGCSASLSASISVGVAADGRLLGRTATVHSRHLTPRTIQADAGLFCLASRCANGFLSRSDASSASKRNKIRWPHRKAPTRTSARGPRPEARRPRHETRGPRPEARGCHERAGPEGPEKAAICEVGRLSNEPASTAVAFSGQVHSRRGGRVAANGDRSFRGGTRLQVPLALAPRGKGQASARGGRPCHWGRLRPRSPSPAAWSVWNRP